MVYYKDKFDSPIGIIYLAASDDGLIYCATARDRGEDMEAWLEKNLPQYTSKEGTNPILDQAKEQLSAYFVGESRKLDLTLQLIGTDFRKKVWQALQTIPYGETRTYGEIAAQIGNPKAARAVGQANNKNPISYFVP